MINTASSMPPAKSPTNVKAAADSCNRFLAFVGSCAAASASLYLLTATFSAIVSYSPINALMRFLPVAGGSALCPAAIIGLLRASGRLLGWLHFACGVLAAILVMVATLRRMGFWMIPIVGSLSGETIAGALVVLIPLGIGGLLWLRKRRSMRESFRVQLVVVSSILLVISLLGLLITAERSAIAAMLAGLAYGGYAWWRPTCRRRTWALSMVDLLFIGLPCVLAFLFFVQFVNFWDWLETDWARFLARPLTDRLESWKNVLVMAGDYRFTGTGLGTFDMALSTYAYLLHVPYLAHAYNLYLHIAVEQGLVGLLAFLVLIGSTLTVLICVVRSASGHYRIFCSALISSVSGMLIHGLVDSSLYASSLMWVAFVPLIAIWLLVHRTWETPYLRKKRGCCDNMVARAFGSRKSAWIGGALIPLAATSMLFMAPGTASAIHTNWGALQQTRAELSVYSWPSWSIQDELRLSDQVDLEPAIHHYQVALAYDSTASGAHRRLGQIALSRRDHDIAISHLEAALVHAPTDQVTHRLLGEAYAISGNHDAALSSWRNVPFTKNQIENRLWWYGLDPDSQKTIWLSEAISHTCLNTDNCE